jgi:MFS transporter, DHA2 family, multidrug resistance protein
VVASLVSIVHRGFSGLVGTIVLEAVNSGSLERGIDVLTFEGFFQSVRLLGGEIGISFIQFFLQKREQFHSNDIGLHIQRGTPESIQRSLDLTAAMLRGATSTDVAAGCGAALLGLTVRRQVFTIAIADSFSLIACASIICLLVIACTSTLKHMRMIAACTALCVACTSGLCATPQVGSGSKSEVSNSTVQSSSSNRPRIGLALEGGGAFSRRSTPLAS